MDIQAKIEAAFKHREMPQQLATLGAKLSGDDDDALWFAGKDWRELSPDDWEMHHTAVSFFTREAFAYYLPSILSLSAYGRCDLLAADQIISSLDRSPTVAYWDGWLTDRFLGLTDEEYDVIKEWVLSLSGRDYVTYGDDALTRAYETVDLLQRETDRMRTENSG
jgi:hypothetical protein